MKAFVSLVLLLLLAGCSSSRFEVATEWGEIAVPYAKNRQIILYYPDVDFEWEVE